ncbi:MAG TPA: universal stress protein [Pseudomonadales bacterium]
MSDYKKILIAVDLSDDSPYVVDKALALASSGAELHMMHVMEPIAVGYAVEVTSIDVEGLHAEASKQARHALLELGGNLGIPAHRLHHVLGQPAREIREMAKELGADLIVMGGHGKHGLDLLFGSTSSGVTHGVSCDLLIVRIPG